MSTKNECECEVNLFVMYVLDLSVFSQNTPHSAAVRVRCVHLGLCVCVHVSLSISSGGSIQNCLKVLHRFGSFRDTSLSYETLKALWFYGMFSLQREIHPQHIVGLVFGHV